MNIPTKVLRSTFITYETYFNHQQLAKRFYKSYKNKKSYSKTNSESELINPNSNEVEQIQFLATNLQPNFKEDILKW